jgi:hypothetical protein
VSATATAAGEQPAPNVKHLRGLPSVPTVATPDFRKAQVVAADATDLREIAVMSGDPGLGKSFAVYHYVANQQLPWLWLDMPPKASPKEIVVRLLRGLTGGCEQRLPVYELADELCDVLAEQPRVVIIDEAQHLDSHGLHQLRYLHDRPDADWALLFVGGVGCEKTLACDPQLDDRIAGRVRFRPLDGEILLETLDAFSPFFARADRQLLLRLNESYACGVFRRWARLLQVGSRLAEQAGTDRLNTTVARAALAKLHTEVRR